MTEQKTSWFSRLKQGLTKSSTQMVEGVTSIFTKRKLDAEMLDELEDLLIRADMGAATAAKIVAKLKQERFDKEVTSEEVREFLAAEIATILQPYAKPLSVDDAKPHIVLVVGVNGNGKTTTIGKITKQLKAEGKSVMLAAVDTFRAAAVEQLQVWGERSGVEVVAGAQNADPASVAYAAVESAQAAGVDVLLMDTAGRLQNKANLMAELQKVIKVIKKMDESAPHSVVQILDATTGQNAVSQVKTFKELVEVTGLIVTKLDGTAKAGVVVALAEQFKLPIHAIGVGEGIDDLRAFDATEFAKSLSGV